MAKNQTSTAAAAKLEPIGKDVEKALRGGLHMSAEAAAIILIGGDIERDVDAKRIELVQQMLATSSDEEKKATLRAAKDAEKVKLPNGKLDNTKPQNYGPLVVALVNHGMGLGTAKSRASEFRTIASAFPHGAFPREVNGWHAAVEYARRSKVQKKEAEAAAQMALARRTLVGEGLEKFDDKEKAQEYADKELAKLAKSAEGEMTQKAIAREVKRILKMGSQPATAIMQQCATALGYNVTQMTKEERKAATATVNEGAPMPERGKAAQSAVH